MGVWADFLPTFQLSKTHDVFALDFLGQGKSWPTRAPSREDGLCYSVDLWTEQVPRAGLLLRQSAMASSNAVENGASSSKLVASWSSAKTAVQLNTISGDFI